MQLSKPYVTMRPDNSPEPPASGAGRPAVPVLGTSWRSKESEMEKPHQFITGGVLLTKIAFRHEAGSNLKKS